MWTSLLSVTHRPQGQQIYVCVGKCVDDSGALALPVLPSPMSLHEARNGRAYADEIVIDS